ncbi:MAG TPA: PEGA domain-containing protein [Ignavibacteriales bacterium]|nr:PEGA domain-containing protein [Ignavibacteriales bacterium]
MKKYFLFIIILLTSVIFYSCGSDTSTNPEPAAQKGSIYVTSDLPGAQIWNGTTNTNKVTPDSITGLDAGNYSITLKFQGLRDTTISATVKAGEKTTLKVKLPLSVVTFGPVRIWETFGTNASQPSGLQLSTGTPYSTSVTDKVDLYFFSTSTPTYKILTGTARNTYFFVGSSANLSDTVSAPLKTSSWKQEVPVPVTGLTNYIFAYDQDQHYSKILFAIGGGNPGIPSYFDVTYIYNLVPNDRRFK